MLRYPMFLHRHFYIPFYHSPRNKRFVKNLARYSIYVLVISFYLLSLFPLADMTIKGEAGDLREAVHTLQLLQTATSESPQTFKKSLKCSIKTMQKLAGLQKIIFQEPNPIESKSLPLITITFRSLYLPSSSYSPSAFISIRRSTFPELSILYLSVNFAPEIPPPVLA